MGLQEQIINQGLVQAGLAPIQQEPTTIETKANRLQERVADKQNRLGYVELAPLTNTASAAELQQRFSDVMDRQIYTNPDGSKYQEVYTNDPVTGNTIINRVPYTIATKYGNPDTEHLYIDNNADNTLNKLGLAATSFTSRYNPNDPEALAITAEYTKKGLKNPDGSPRTYGWAPGPQGVTVDNGALLDVELPYNPATQFEYDVHSNLGQISNRGLNHGFTIAQLGDGKTEYTIPQAPLWSGQDTNRFDEYLGKPVKPPIQHIDPSKPIVFSKDFNPLGRQSDALGALGSSADTLYSNFAGSIGSGLENMGIEYGKEVRDYWANQAKTSEKRWNYTNSNAEQMKEGGKQLHTLFSSVGNGDVEGSLTALSKLYDTTKDLNMIEALAQSAPEMALSVHPIGMAALALSKTEESLQEMMKKNGGKEVSTERALGVFGGAMAYVALNHIGVETILHPGVVVKALKPITTKLSDSQFNGMISSMLVQPLAKLTTTAIAEGGTEALQDMVVDVAQELYADKYGNTTGFEAILKKNAPKYWESAYGGAVLGGAMSAPVVAKETILDPLLNTVRSNTANTDVSATPDKVINDIVKYSPDITNEKVAATMSEIKAQSLDPEAAPIVPHDRASYAVGALGVNSQLDDVAAIDQVTINEKTTPEEAAAIHTASTEFDNAYNDLATGLGQTFKDIAEVKATQPEYADTDFTPNVKEYVNDTIHGFMDGANAISGLLDIRAKLEASVTDKSLVANKLANIDQRISNLMPIFNASTEKEIHDIVTNSSIPVESKVAQIIGSSSASKKDIEELKATEGITADAIEMLELKNKLISNDIASVKQQKLYGGGRYNGAMQWIGTLLSQSDNPTAIKYSLDKISNFSATQRAKLNKFKNAELAWDTAHKMPWIIDTEAKQYTSNEKSDYRSFAMSNDKSIKASLLEPVTLGKNVYDNIYTISTLIDNISSEQEIIDDLVKLATKIGSTSAARTEAVEPKVVSEVKVPAEGVSNATEAPTAITVAHKIANGEPLTTEDLQVQANEGSAVERELTNIKNEVTDINSNTKSASKPTKKSFVKVNKKDVVDESAEVSSESQELIQETTPTKKTDSTIVTTSNGKYNIGIKEYMINYIKTHKAIQQKLKDLGVDLKDC